MLLWHIDYFELNMLEKGQEQEGNSVLPISSRKQEIILTCERYPPYTRKKEIPASRSDGEKGTVDWSQEKFIQTDLAIIIPT
jgi:hypothetical protein